MPITNFHDIVYFSDKDLWTLESKIFYILDGKWSKLGFNSDKDLIKLNEKLSFYKLWLSNYLLESDDEDYLISLKEPLRLQWVEMLWNFNRNWKNYLIVYKSENEWWITSLLLEKCKVKLMDIYMNSNKNIMNPPYSWNIPYIWISV